MATNSILWNELHKKDMHRLKYPAENVVRFVMKNFRRDGSESFLDMGCGAGRHVMLAANEGLIPYGIDFSHEGVSYTKRLLKDNGYDKYSDNIVEGDIKSMPFENGFFEGIISWGVLYYLKSDEVRQTVSEIYRILKNGGLFLFLVRNEDDYRYIDMKNSGSKEVEKNTFIIHEDSSEKSAAEENDMIMHFFCKEEIETLFASFSEIEINKVTISFDNDSYMNSDYLVKVRK